MVRTEPYHLRMIAESETASMPHVVWCWAALRALSPGLQDLNFLTIFPPTEWFPAGQEMKAWGWQAECRIPLILPLVQISVLICFQHTQKTPRLEHLPPLGINRGTFGVETCPTHRPQSSLGPAAKLLKWVQSWGWKYTLNYRNCMQHPPEQYKLY
jgi:hypothetical protein